MCEINRGRQYHKYFLSYTFRVCLAKSKKKKKKVRVRGYFLSMMWHGWWQVREWGNVHKDWSDVPNNLSSGRGKMLVSLI